jgi:hypothetical protein
MSFSIFFLVVYLFIFRVYDFESAIKHWDIRHIKTITIMLDKSKNMFHGISSDINCAIPKLSDWLKLGCYYR